MSEAYSRRPLIGVTGPDEGGSAAWIATKFVIWLAGGHAVRITPSSPHEQAKLRGLVLGGGADIHPSRYKEDFLATIKSESKRTHKLGPAFFASIAIWLLRELFAMKASKSRVDVERDDLEFKLLKHAVDTQLPVLGICRGGQLINVYWGGSLHQDITAFYVENPKLHTVRPRKLILVENGTTMARILGRVRAKVNSLHNQSVNVVAPPLKVSAREANGVIQAIEHKTLPFMIGVQWHPEFLPFRPDQRRIFHHLVEAARVHSRQPTLGWNTLTATAANMSPNDARS